MHSYRYRTIADRILGLKLVPSNALLNRNVSYEFMNRQMVWHAFTVCIISLSFRLIQRNEYHVMNAPFQEFLLFLLPIINTRSLRRRIYRKMSSFRWSDLLPQSISQRPSTSSSEETAQRGKYYQLPESDCAICAEDASFEVSILKESTPPLTITSTLLPSNPNERLPTSYIPKYPINTPYRASCGHVYCYVCISDRLLRAADEGDQYWECLRCEEPIRHANRWEPEPAGASRDRGRRLRSANEDDSNQQRFWTSNSAGSNVSRLGHSYGTSELNDSELSAMDFDSVSSIGLKTHSGSDDLSE